MNEVAVWVASKGLELATPVVMNWLDITDQEALVRQELKTINDKLDVLIKAPFKQAVMHLREGEIEKCKDKLIEAITLDELNLPARLLYIDILRLNKKYALALEQYWETLDRFGPVAGLIPAGLLEAFGSHVHERKPLAGRFNYSHTDTYSDKWHPTSVWCSLGGYAVRWEKETSFWTWNEKSAVTVHEWGGNTLAEIDDREAAVACLTNSYAIISRGDGKYRVYRLPSGELLPSKLSEEEFHTAFAAADKLMERGFGLFIYEDESFSYAGANLVRGTYYRTETGSYTTPSQYGGRRTYTTTHEGGQLTVSF